MKAASKKIISTGDQIKIDRYDMTFLGTAAGVSIAAAGYKYIGSITSLIFIGYGIFISPPIQRG